MEDQCKLVSSRGILKSCCLRPLHPISSTNKVSLTAGSLSPGGSIYICNDALEDFFENYLHKINIKFVLVSGDSDRNINHETINLPPIRSGLESTHLMGWFCQNLTVSHPKLYQLPIGVDYHTASVANNPFEPKALTPLEQEDILLSTSLNAPPFLERSNLVYADFHPEPNKPTRGMALEAFSSQGVRPVKRITRSESWSLCSNFKYVLSPIGVGLDCHRTWESLALQAMPILMSTGIDSLYQDLPVLFMSDWAKMDNKSSYSKAIFDRHPQILLNERLQLSYWIDKIKDCGQRK